MDTATTSPRIATGTLEGPPSWRLLPAAPSDVERIAELRAVVMRPDLERLGRYDEVRVRQRLRDVFVPAHTWLIESEGAFAGCVTLRPLGDTAAVDAVPDSAAGTDPSDADAVPDTAADGDAGGDSGPRPENVHLPEHLLRTAGCYWLENFYLAPAHQGRGLGGAVLRHLLARTDGEGRAVRLDVLQGSSARRLYERHGFSLEREDPVDVYLVRPARV
ncbi:GNAT family N-acetyltransferase [Streptomyces sp. NPDC091272]|uniref:GNAT family N-acetyltransferase n=1 Tax=Streptomyces sp. NPDC091272 TaxID=3365981 RepID=UPI00380236CF